MSGQRVTRSNSLNRNNNSDKESKVRKLSELSPDLETKATTNKKPKAISREMEEILDKIRNDLSSINKRLDTMNVLEQKIDTISSDLSKFKKDIDSINGKVDKVESEQIQLSIKIDSNQTQLNIMKQLKLDDQIMITDVPLNINKDNFIDNINDWSKNLLQNLGYKKLILIKSKKASTAFIHFWNYKDKFRFMDFIKSRQKQDKKYIPITSGQVFQLNEDDVGTVSVLHFQTPLTKINQEIFREANNYKKDKKIERCWLMEGSIYIRKNGHKSGLPVDSIEHLRNIITDAGTSQEGSTSAMEISADQ